MNYLLNDNITCDQRCDQDVILCSHSMVYYVSFIGIKQNISMTKGKKSEKQNKTKKKNEQNKNKKNKKKTNQKKKERKKQPNKTNKKQPPTYI